MRHYTTGVSYWHRISIALIVITAIFTTILVPPLQLQAQDEPEKVLVFTPTSLVFDAAEDATRSLTKPYVLLQTVEAPAIVTYGTPFFVDASWSSIAELPDNRWEVVYQFRNSDTRIVAEFVSKFDLFEVLQVDGSSITDEFFLPSMVEAGTHTISVLVRDPTNERTPLALAIEGVQADGSYLLGDIEVKAGSAARSKPLVSITYLPFVESVRSSALLASDLKSLEPEQLSVSAPEIVNPMRGLYRWMGQEYALQPTPSLDAYGRYTWRDLEPTQGDYSFAKLEADIAKAAREGRKYSFRVRTVVATKGSAIPDYAMTGAGWWADYNKDNARDTYIPDWNDPAFLERLDTFMQALGKRYNNDPRVAFLDIGLFGNWGEWHMSGFSYPSSSGAQRATTTTRYRLVDMHIDAFPSTPLVMMTDDAEALVYAMKRSPRIGWRRDSLGWNTGHFGKVERDPVRWNAIKDRWKTALVVSEFCNPRYQNDPEVFEQALIEVERYHVSLVSNANTIKWSELSAAGKEAFVRLGKTAGYRLVLDELVLPGTILAGSTFDITTRWENTGVAPVYEPWQVAVQLRKAGSDEVAWETTSGIELTTVLPGNVSEQSDRVTVPGNLGQGAYDVVVVVGDPRQTRAPLALALADVQPDGSYRLGSVSVR